MSPISSDKAELERVLDGIRLGLAAQTCEAHPVVDALGAVFVADVEHDGLFSEVEEQPRDQCAPFVSFPPIPLCAAAPAPALSA